MSFSRSRAEGCLSDLRIDRWVRGELASDDEAGARQHLAGCDACRARVGEIEAARASFRTSAPPLTRPRPRRRRWTAWTVGASTALAAAAALVLFLQPRGPDGTRLKGGGRGVAFFVEHAGRVRRGQAGELVAPGDKLQLTYSSATPFYGAILSVDGARRRSRYFPDEPRAARLDAGQDRSFPISTVLDEVLGKETLFVLFCDEPIALDPAEAALAAPGCHVERLEIEKR